METKEPTKNKFFNSIWIVFLVLLSAYSIYVLIVSKELTKVITPSTDQILKLVSFKIILGIYFFIAALNIKKIFNKKFWLPLIIFAGLVSRVVLIPSAPVLEDDYYRYLWDGAVTANLINPFEYSPDNIVNDSLQIPEKLIQLKNESGEVFENINHRQIRTIYPMLSQFVFAASYLIAPWQTWFWKLILLIFDLLMLTVLFRLLKEFNLPMIFISFYWLNPIVIHEFYNAAHMDLLVLPFVMFSLYFFIKNKITGAIIFLAIAAGFKLWPLVLLPLLLRNVWQDKKVFVKNLAVFSFIVILLFIPVISAGIDSSLGYVKYAESWVNNAAFYNLFSELIKWIISITGFTFSYNYLLPRLLIALVYLIFLIFLVKNKSVNDTSFFEKALLIIAVLFLLSPAQFPWYYTWMVPLLVIRPKAALLLYPVLLPLYNLNYLSDYFIYFQHLPVISFFLWELKTQRIKKYFEFAA